jgi:cysteine desulfurase/selenocysteine lyase
MSTESVSHDQAASPVNRDADDETSLPKPIDSPVSAGLLTGVEKETIAKIRREFPALSQTIREQPLVYLDNAASAQKPRVVIEAEAEFYRESYSNVHRGVHYLAEKATRAYEDVRIKAKAFLNAANAREIVFVRGATEGINLVAASYGRKNLKAGEEILITEMEHHSNIVPWQLLCEEKNAKLRVVPINDRGEIDLNDFEGMLNDRTKLVAVCHVSNALGTINPVAEMIEVAHRRGIPVLLDGAQAAPHLAIDVQALKCDFYTFSSHKLFGPTGIGVLYGRLDLLEAMPPYQGGGEMIRTVTFDKGLGAAIDYLHSLDWNLLARHESSVLAYATDQLAQSPGIRLIGTAKEKTGVVSFVVDGVHAHDVGTILDLEGIAVRAGHHCAQPVMDHFGLAATARASFALYNTHEEVDRLIQGLAKVREVFG